MNETSKILLLASILVCNSAFAMRHEPGHAGAGADAQESLLKALERQGAAYDVARNPSKRDRILYAVGGIGTGIVSIALCIWIESLYPAFGVMDYPPSMGPAVIGGSVSLASLDKAVRTQREDSANTLKLLQGTINKSNLSIEDVVSADKGLTSLKCNINEKFTLTDVQLAEIDTLRDRLLKHLQPKND